jgi:hypothetical protein
MTPEALSKFCITNAGKEATGERDGKRYKGRIIAFTPSKSGGWIILEDATLAKKKLPNPLPSMPYVDNKWSCVVAECHLGIPCNANSVKIVAATNTYSMAQDKAMKHIPTAPLSVKPCGHTECHIDWCWKSYAGFE